MYAVLGIALAISFVTDVREQMIYNVVTYPTILVSLGLRFFMVGWRNPDPRLADWTLLVGLVGFIVGFGLFYVMFLMGGMMGGDVKLMGAVGAALGFRLVFYAIIFTALVGGLEAILYLLWDGSLGKTLSNTGKRLAHVLRLKRLEGPPMEKKYVPYGVAIALGTVWAVYYDWTASVISR